MNTTKWPDGITTSTEQEHNFARIIAHSPTFTRSWKPFPTDGRHPSVVTFRSSNLHQFHPNCKTRDTHSCAHEFCFKIHGSTVDRSGNHGVKRCRQEIQERVAFTDHSWCSDRCTAIILPQQHTSDLWTNHIWWNGFPSHRERPFYNQRHVTKTAAVKITCAGVFCFKIRQKTRELPKYVARKRNRRHGQVCTKQIQTHTAITTYNDELNSVQLDPACRGRLLHPQASRDFPTRAPDRWNRCSCQGCPV